MMESRFERPVWLLKYSWRHADNRVVLIDFSAKKTSGFAPVRLHNR
jgi:hypothetical protein